MGIYFNPGNENFKEIITRLIYVDKTMMINIINNIMDNGNKYMCISRPRRFGKTTAGNMLVAYYSKGCDSKELFDAYRISEVPGYLDRLNKYNVIKIDVAGAYHNVSDHSRMIEILSRKIIYEMADEYPDIEFSSDDMLAEAILRVYRETGESFIIILDEYDVLVREQAEDELFDRYLSFLNGLFKDDTLNSAISLAYLTGILPIVRDKVQSKLNNFTEYTMLDSDKLAPYIGFTDEEVRSLCNEYGLDYSECRAWYDGYNQLGYDIYNPKSVITAVEKNRFDNYWNMTSTYQVISDRISQNFEGTKDAVIRMLSGESVDVDVAYYMNTMTSFINKDDLLTYLIHIGYLAYDYKNKTCRIPNREIVEEWERAIRINSEYNATNQIIEASKELLNKTLQGDGDAVAKALDVSHIHVASNRSYNNEDVFQSAIYLAYIYAYNYYTIIREMTTGKGYADVVFIPYKPDYPALIIELKRNKSTDSALHQIKERRYFESLRHYRGQLLFVGINYDEETKLHECKIEKYEVN